MEFGVRWHTTYLSLYKKLPPNLESKNNFYFGNPFVGQELRRACPGSFHLGFVMQLHYISTTTIWRYVLTAHWGWMPKVARYPGWQVLLAIGWELSWGCQLEHEPMASTSSPHGCFRVVGLHTRWLRDIKQSMCPMAQEKLHCPLWCSLRSHAAAPFLHCTICKWVRSLCQFMRVGYRSRFWWKECPKFVNIKLPQMTS